MSVIIYELNEVPRRLFDFYASVFPRSAFGRLRSASSLFETLAADVGGLSPWITWPTMHRGVSNVEHGISELGQELTAINLEFPSVYTILANNNVKVGVFGCLQSYPLPESLENYCFYVPDTFAAGEECFPDKLSDFQSFNLSMVRANGRNVHRGVAVKGAANFIKNSFQMGLKPKTFFKLTNQILIESVNKDRLVRRRTSQVEIAFDLYFKQLRDTKPDISFFFTNHVASSMHRYWPTIFPQDYEFGKFESGWLKRWSGEIPHSVNVANFQLQKLIDYCNATNSELIVCSSMGQGPVKDTEPVEKQVLITNVKKLAKHIGLKPQDWQLKLAMAPRIVITPLTPECLEKLKLLENIKINGTHLDIHRTKTGEVRLEISLLNQKTLKILDGDKSVSPSEIGIENVDLQDASGSYAYHIPEGIMLHYCPKKITSRSVDKTWTTINVLDFAPSLLSKFGIHIPSYMLRENIFGTM